ncbi:MAG: hypothetical protein HC866_03840 [Leptolyngbyaceae cyanobacterium RU_5_1]|nr:hypothetical protein [Leptolyngbyaceae cyanobacterium RU_5_1]
MASRISITSAMAAANAAGQLPSSSELEAVSSSLRKAQTRLNAAEVLTRNADELSRSAVQFVFSKFPDAASTAEFLFTSSLEAESHSFKEDVDILLRLLTYCLVVGNDDPLELKPLEEIFSQISYVIHKSSEISPLWYIEVLEFFRNNHGLSGESAVEISLYINYIIAAFR